MSLILLDAASRRRVSGGGGGGGVSCAYPLNGDATAIGGTQMTVSGADNQTASIALANSLNAAAVPPGTFPAWASLNFGSSTGVKGIEFAPSVAAAENTGSNSSAYSAQVAAFDAAFSVVCVVAAQAWKNGTFKVQVDTDGGTTIFSGLASLPARIGIDFDTAAGVITMTFDGVQKTLSYDAFVPGNLFVAMQASASSLHANDIGKTVGGTLFTDASGFTETHATGATDPCGNEI